MTVKSGKSVLERITKDEDGCWLFDGYVNPNGYGQVYTGGGRANATYEPAHRVAYRELVGEIPEGITLHHICKVKRCVNPAHLSPVTNSEHKRIECGGMQVRLPYWSREQREGDMGLGLA